MFTADSYDPLFLTRLRHEQPRLHPNHIGLIRLAHAAGLEDLDRLDRELEVLAAHRRAVLDRLSTYRGRLWPGMTGRHHRRTCRAESNPLPPAPVDADPLWGPELRRMAVAVLRRHGAQTLREVHGLLHRYGYVIDSRRPVQRLADALAYEVQHGRLERVRRGVYGPVPPPPVGRRRHVPATTLPDEPFPWTGPGSTTGDDDRAIDPMVADDAERWSGGEWPAEAQAGGSWCAGAPDPLVGEIAEDLDVTIAATRRRLAALHAERLGPPPPRRTLHPTSIPPAAPFDPDDDAVLAGDDDADPDDQAAPVDPLGRPAPPRPPAPPTGTLGDDSSTNRRPRDGTDGTEAGGELEPGAPEVPGSPDDEGSDDG